MPRAITLMFILFFSSILLFGCASTSGPGRDASYSGDEAAGGKPATLRIMHFMAEEGAAVWLQDVIERFRQRYPRVEVEVIAANADNYDAGLRNRIASDDSPDIFLLARLDGRDRIYIERGLLLDLSGQPFLERISGIERHRIEGGIYGMPFDMNGYGVFYNKDVFEQAGIHEPPTTYGAFIDALERIERIGVVPIAAGYKELNIMGSDLLTDLLVSQMADHPRWRADAEARRIRFAEDETMRQALIRFAERFRYAQSRPFETDRMEAAELVASGKAAMLLNGTWYIDSIMSHHPDVRLGVFPFPHSDDPAANKLPLGSPIGGWAVRGSTSVREYALAFLEEMTSDQMAQSLRQNKRAITVIGGPSIPQSDAFADIQRYLDSGMTVDYTGVITYFSEPFHQRFNQIIAAYLLSPDRNVDDCLAELDAEFDRLARMSQ